MSPGSKLPDVTNSCHWACTHRTDKRRYSWSKQLNNSHSQIHLLAFGQKLRHNSDPNSKTKDTVPFNIKLRLGNQSA